MNHPLQMVTSFAFALSYVCPYDSQYYSVLIDDGDGVAVAFFQSIYQPPHLN